MSGEPEPTMTVSITRREHAVIRFALWRFMHAAYDNASWVDARGARDVEKTRTAFLRDARDAEALRGKFGEFSPAKERP